MIPFKQQDQKKIVTSDILILISLFQICFVFLFYASSHVVMSKNNLYCLKLCRFVTLLANLNPPVCLHIFSASLLFIIRFTETTRDPLSPHAVHRPSALVSVCPWVVLFSLISGVWKLEPESLVGTECWFMMSVQFVWVCVCVFFVHLLLS